MSQSQARVQARHQMVNVPVKGGSSGGGKRKSLRQHKAKIISGGILGVMHAKFGAAAREGATIYPQFQVVEGLGDDENASKVRAEQIYVASLTGDDAGLEAALGSLLADAEAAPADADAAAAAEAGDGSFDPALTLGEAPAAPDAAWTVRDIRGVEPLALAASKGHSGCIQLLLRAKASIGHAAPSCGRSALHRAAEGGHAEAVQALVDGGAELSSTQRSGQSALWSAASRGYERCHTQTRSHDRLRAHYPRAESAA